MSVIEDNLKHFSPLKVTVSGKGGCFVQTTRPSCVIVNQTYGYPLVQPNSHINIVIANCKKHANPFSFFRLPHQESARSNQTWNAQSDQSPLRSQNNICRLHGSPLTLTSEDFPEATLSTKVHNERVSVLECGAPVPLSNDQPVAESTPFAYSVLPPIIGYSVHPMQRLVPPSVFIRVHPWLKIFLPGSPPILPHPFTN